MYKWYKDLSIFGVPALHNQKPGTTQMVLQMLNLPTMYSTDLYEGTRMDIKDQGCFPVGTIIIKAGRFFYLLFHQSHCWSQSGFRTVKDITCLSTFAPSQIQQIWEEERTAFLFPSRRGRSKTVFWSGTLGGGFCGSLGRFWKHADPGLPHSSSSSGSHLDCEMTLRTENTCRGLPVLERKPPVQQGWQVERNERWFERRAVPSQMDCHAPQREGVHYRWTCLAPFSSSCPFLAPPPWDAASWRTLADSGPLISHFSRTIN